MRLVVDIGAALITADRVFDGAPSLSVA